MHVDGWLGGAAHALGRLLRVRPWLRHGSVVRPEVRVGAALLNDSVEETCNSRPVICAVAAKTCRFL